MSTITPILVLWLAFMRFSSSLTIDLVCRNEKTGENLDWFTLYKLPKLKYAKNEMIRNGTAYAYMTSEDQAWKFSDLSINSTTSLPALTLEYFYSLSSQDDTFGYVLYNDQADNITFTKGHTKGVILFNEKSSVWIVHSIPHYPPKREQAEYFINPAQCFYGQSMLCMSFDFDQIELIGQQLLFTYPQVYDYFIPSSLKQKYTQILSNLMLVIEGNHVELSPWSNLNKLTTRGGEQMMSFAKFTNFDDDLYSGLVAPRLNSNLFTETWNNGNGTFDSNCTTDYQVKNIEKLYFRILDLDFSVHNDHSKWAVTSFNDYRSISSNKVACIGDINRQEDQLVRAGGTVCFMNNTNVWDQYYKLVQQVEPCP